LVGVAPEPAKSQRLVQVWRVVEPIPTQAAWEHLAVRAHAAAGARCDAFADHFIDDGAGERCAPITLVIGFVTVPRVACSAENELIYGLFRFNARRKFGHFPPPFGFGLQVGQSVEQLPHFMFMILSSFVDLRHSTTEGRPRQIDPRLRGAASTC
jgi:hypothetical protein